MPTTRNRRSATISTQMRTTAKGLEYPNRFYWDINLNPYASIVNGLADCTAFSYGAIIEDGHRPVVSRVCNANNFHKYLINGWSYIPFDEEKLEIGDIVEWSAKCHVAVVSDKEKNISGSFYTGMHGRAYYNGKFDTRSFVSLKEMSDWMVANYPTRFFHHWSIEEESRWCGGSPEYILKHPLYSVPEDKTRPQIHVLTDDMNVRDNSNNVLKRAENGFYNVLGTKESGGYTWYEVEKGKYIAGYPGRVVFIPEADDVLQRLQFLENENAELKSKLDQIGKILNA